MTASVLPCGTEIAIELAKVSDISANAFRPPLTLGDLMSLWEVDPPRHVKMLRTTCVRLADYQQRPVEEITLEAVAQTRNGLRPYLESRKYGENSIRTYVNHVRMILLCAESFGWNPTPVYSQAWMPIMELARSRKCQTFVQHLAASHRHPDRLTSEDVDRVLSSIPHDRLSRTAAVRQRREFWRIIRDLEYPNLLPTSIVRQSNYGIALDAFPDSLKKEVQEVLRWKQAIYALDRPKDARHRPPTLKRLKDIISMVYGFAVNIQGVKGIEGLEALMQKRIVGGFIEWCINERRVKGRSLQHNLRLLSAIFRQHPRYKASDWTWTKSLIDSIPIEPESVTKKRKAEKYLDYATLEAIPEKIRAGRAVAAKKGPKQVALVVRDELLIKWLNILPWRQRNIRECRIDGPEPNLFKAAVSDLETMELPPWAIEERQKNPAAEFWQFHFSESETKTGCEVHALVPRQLIPLLEEYLRTHRPHLYIGSDPGTLFVNEVGKPLALKAVTDLVSRLTLRHGGRRVTPHIFRDIVAYTWLKHHPKDYLTLSKHLWHSGPTEVIRTYGSRFNESSGVVMMESWLDEREGRPGRS
jgi:hypothetical protein